MTGMIGIAIKIITKCVYHTLFVDLLWIQPLSSSSCTCFIPRTVLLRSTVMTLRHYGSNLLDRNDNFHHHKQITFILFRQNSFDWMQYFDSPIPFHPPNAIYSRVLIVTPSLLKSLGYYFFCLLFFHSYSVFVRFFFYSLF